MAPPLEIQGFSYTYIQGFSIKLENGDIKWWGTNSELYKTAWRVIGGPIIGYHYALGQVWGSTKMT